MAPHFGRQPKATKATHQRSHEMEALRRRWEVHAEKMPPNPSPAPAMVEFRTEAAEYDVKVSRFVGAVLMDRAGDLAPPTGGQGLVARLDYLETKHDDAAEEIEFYRAELEEVARVIRDARRLQRTSEAP